MLERTREGKTIPKGFSKKGWDQIARKMITMFGPDFEKEKCRNKHRTFEVLLCCNENIDDGVWIWLGSRKKNGHC